MFQIEVKRYLIQHCFNPADGWTVVVDIDAMEMGKGAQNSEEKRRIAAETLQWFEDHGIAVSPHPIYGRVDVFVEHDELGRYLIEAEGNTRKQKEQAMYSALGQAILLMSEQDGKGHYGIAVPDEPKWLAQVKKIPPHIRDSLRLDVYLVSPKGVRTLD